MAIDARQLNALTLAYIGDAIYEVHIREYLIDSGMVKPDQLHHKAIRYVAADRQASVLHHWLHNNLLTEEEVNVVKRGRNMKSRSTPKNMSISDYRHATAFEALLGYHHLLKNEERLASLMQQAITWLNQAETSKGQRT